MGKLQHARTLLMNLELCWECFFAELPADMDEFDCGMFDGMQYVAGLVVGSRDETFDAERVARRLEEATAHHMNLENDPRRPRFRRMLVVMLDTVHNVPRNKAGVQRTRDGDEGGHMDEALYEALCAEQRPLFDSLFVSNATNDHRYHIAGKKLWRSNNLKLQLWRKLTYSLLHTQIRAGSVLMIDEGIALSLSEYQQRRDHILQKYGNQTGTRFERECLVTERLTRSKRSGLRRFMVWPDGHYHAFATNGIGEADIKIQAYIRRDNGLKRYLVINQDTDIIFVLLLHMQNYLWHDERDAELEVWLDTRCPSDKQATRPYRYINIKLLYQQINALFAREYPHVRYPVPTFCFLMFALETDFTRKFAATLKITPALVWNTFSELHHYDVLCKDYIKYSQSTKGGCDQTVRASQRTLSPELYGILNDAVQYDCVRRRYLFGHDAIKRFFYLLCQLRLMAVREDLGVASPPQSNLRSAVVAPIEPEELLIYATDIDERLQYYGKHTLRQSTLDSHLVQLKRQLEPGGASVDVMMAPVPKVQKVSQKKKEVTPKFTAAGNGWLKPNKQYQAPPPISAEINQVLEEAERAQRETDQAMEVEEQRRIGRLGDIVNSYHHQTGNRGGSSITGSELTPAYVRQYEKKLAEYSKLAHSSAEGGHYFGVPCVNDMLARGYRIEWYMAYLTDGWRHPGPYGALNCVARARHDQSLSEWGWREVEISAPDEIKRALNCSYYVTLHDRAANRLVLKAIEETNAVSHRRVYR